MKYFILIFCLLFNSYIVTAAEQESKLHTFFNPESISASLHAGSFQVDEEPQLVNIRNKYAFAGGIHADLSRYPNLGLDLEIISFSREYDTQVGAPVFGTIDKDTQVSTDALLFGARAFIPAGHPFRAYASAGLGYFKTRMTVYGSVFGLPAWHEETDDQLTLYYGAGLKYMFGNWGLSLDYRHFNLKGDFAGFQIKNANIGGDTIMLGWHIRM